MTPRKEFGVVMFGFLEETFSENPKPQLRKSGHPTHLDILQINTAM